MSQLPGLTLAFFAALGLASALGTMFFADRPRVAGPFSTVALVCAVMVGLLCFAAFVVGPRWGAL